MLATRKTASPKASRCLDDSQLFLSLQSTLVQLIGEDGRIANVDFYDRAACAYRGISLEKYNKDLTFNDLFQLLCRMSLYKLNYLQWDGKCACSEAEANLIREFACGYGITLVTQIPAIPNVDFIDLEDNAQISASSRIFLRTASKDGGWFYLKGMEVEDWEALMAFSERYWRGKGAGEGTVENDLPDSVSTAGTRLANFMEKVAVHRVRFQDFPIARFPN